MSMQCTYAVTLSTKKWTNETLEQCVAAITNWLPKNHDHLPANLRVRVRPLGDDDVFRAELQNTYAAGVDSILITLAALSGQLVFDLRERFVPASNAVVPKRRSGLPPKRVLELVSTMTQLLEVYDAERRVDGRVRPVMSELDGQALAADYRDAPARRLPIIAEFVKGRDPHQTLTGSLAADLIGVAVVAHLGDEKALQAFNDYCGSPVLSTNYITVLWPRGVQPFTLHTSQPSKEQILGPILDAAANQPEPVVPMLARPTPRTAEPVRRTDVSSTTNSELERMQQLLDEQRMHIDAQDELIETIETEREELEEALDDRDQTIALQQERLDELILNKTELEAYLVRVAPSASMPRVLDAVYRAAKECKHLEFARSAYDTANELEGPVPFTVFSILRSLDQAVGEWRADRIPAAGLRSYLRQLRVDYVPDISENARQKYVDDYTITHEGKKIVLGPHVRSGRRRHLLRIYLHVDEANKTMLVGKVTRHLEDSTT
jgi:hypothetical protein